MTDNNWYKIWNNRQIKSDCPNILAGLIRADGFEGLGQITEPAWHDYVQLISEKLKWQPSDTLFEIGCGAGAFLYPFYTQSKKVAGIDYSETLVNMALSAMPDADLRVTEAIDIPTQTQFDVVVANSVFFYFPSYNYAQIVLERMLQVATKSIGILDVPDLSQQAYALALRKKQMTEAEYAHKYEGLEHLYYTKDWFRQALTGKNVKVQIEDQKIPDYLHSTYRFNVFIEIDN